jgi:membrane protein DedA with SNARE-associated domain
MSNNNSNFKEKAFDIVKSIMMWLVVTAGAFLYWMFVLLLISIFLMNIWKTSIEDLLQYGIILTVITSIAYLVILLRRKFK